MPTANKSKDTEEWMTRVDIAQKDLQRYLKFRDGLGIVEIAAMEGIDPKAVQSSLRIGRQMYELEQQMRLRDAKYETAIQNEKLRSRIHKRVADQLIDAIDKLLQGKRRIVETNKATGQVTFHDIDDPEVIAMGIAAAQKAISLEERPTSTGTVVNVLQSTSNEGGGNGQTTDLTFEQRLRTIRAAQVRQIPASSETPASRQIIEVEATPVEAELVSEEPLF